MKRPSLADIERAAAEYRAASQTEDAKVFRPAFGRLAWTVALSLYPESFCQDRLWKWNRA